MKYQELNNKTAKDLHGMVAELKKEMFNLRMQVALGAGSNKISPARYRMCRRDIARIKTKLRTMNIA